MPAAGSWAIRAIGATVNGHLARLLHQVAGAGQITALAGRARLDQTIAIEPTSAAATVRPYASLLDRVGVEGIRLTSAGRLPPFFVGEAMAMLHDRVDWIGKANREDHTRPVQDLRESARRLGLVRKTGALLVLTPAGRRLRGDPERLWWHLASRLPDGRRDVELDAGTLLLLAVAARELVGGDAVETLLARGLTEAGWRLPDGRPINRSSAFDYGRDTWTTLRNLDALPGERYGTALTPPSAVAAAFARAALTRP